jgi:hypothetical protein
MAATLCACVAFPKDRTDRIGKSGLWERSRGRTRPGTSRPDVSGQLALVAGTLPSRDGRFVMDEVWHLLLTGGVAFVGRLGAIWVEKHVRSRRGRRGKHRR